MLKAKAIRQVGAAPQVIEGTSVIVEDALGNPLAVIVETSERMNLVVTVNDKDFNNVLTRLGLNKIVVNTEMDLDSPPAGAQRLDPTQIGGFIHGD